MQQYEFDIVIVGAGVAGLTLALGLAHLPLRIAIVEARTFKSTPEGQHVRVSAYNLASQKFFTKLGVWEHIRSEQKSPFQKIAVWDGEGSGRIHFDCTDLAKPALGHIIANEACVVALREAANEKKNVQLFCPFKASTVDVNNQYAAVCDESTQLRARLLVGADGAQSWLRQQLQVPTLQTPYGSTAVICNVRTQKPHHKTARQVFLPGGPLAFLPLNDPHGCSIVWSTTPQHAQDLSALTEQEFCAELSSVFDFRLGAVVSCMDQPLAFPLVMRHAKQYVGPRWALVGDAAHTIHPLAGQGINLGLQDVQALVSVIEQAHHAHRDIGLKQNLRPFERSRKGGNQLMITAMQGFKDLFGSDINTVRSLRSAGLNFVDGSRSLKKVFMQHAVDG